MYRTIPAVLLLTQTVQACSSLFLYEFDVSPDCHNILYDRK
jgi:hypothetical protein